MKKVTIVLPRSEQERVLQFLQEESVVHLIKHSELSLEESVSSDTSYHLAQLQFALDFIIRMKKELGIRDKRSIKNMFAGKPLAALSALEGVADRITIPALIETLQHTNDGLTAVDARILELHRDIESLEPWKSLLFRADHSTLHTSDIVHRLLSISISEEQGIEEALTAVPTALWQVVHRVQGKKDTTVYGELVAHRDDAAAVELFEQEMDATPVTLPVASEESIAGKHEALVRERDTLKQKRLAILEDAKRIVAQEQDIRFAYDALLHRLEREKSLESIRQSAYVTVITGWIPASWVSRFSQRIADVFPDVFIESVDPEERDTVPILFQNNALVRPFEAVTDLYGKPAYHELDPTGPLAIFFLISFALALTDAGYGIVIMIATFIAERFLRLNHEMQKMMRLLFFGGAMTVVMGALTGGWFSIDLSALSDGPMKSILLGVKLIDPLKQPIVFLATIFGFGVIQLMYAWVVRGIYHWKKGDKVIAIMDDFSWTTLVATIMLWLASSKGFFLVSYALPLKWLMYAAILFIVGTQGRSSKNIFLRIGGGVLSLNALIAFVSDMLSYSRLLALGLATGIIGLVVNLIASMVHESIPALGVVLAGVVLLVGHVFNLGINALGAFIHSGRLQFVEFFPKFLEGGGVAFRPFGRVGKYVDNPKDFMKVF